MRTPVTTVATITIIFNTTMKLFASVLFLLCSLSVSVSSSESLENPTCDAVDCPSTKDNESKGTFLLPPLKPGEVATVHWKDNGEELSPYAARVGFPPSLKPTLFKFLEETGLLKEMWDLEYTHPLEPDTLKFINVTRNGGETVSWHANRPGSKWKSNMHWVQVSNEAAYEDALKMLADGDFDVVLDGIAKHYNLDSLWVQGIGFVSVSHCSKGYVHHDMTDTGGKFFNVLVPLLNVPDAPPELILVDDEGRRGEIKYQVEDNVAIVVGDDALHGTQACDYRDVHGMRMTATFYIADVNPDNAETISYDETSVFPVPGTVDYTLANTGRHWSPGGNSLKNDPGRKRLSFEDELEDCPALAAQGKCESDVDGVRQKCLITCQVYIPNTYQVNDEVDIYSEGDWYPGRVAAINSDGTFDIRWDDDGSVEVGFQHRHVRFPEDLLDVA